jgi:hypothetical protein
MAVLRINTIEFLKAACIAKVQADFCIEEGEEKMNFLRAIRNVSGVLMVGVLLFMSVQAEPLNAALRRTRVDLVPTALSATVGGVVSGGNFTVNDTVKNQGASNVMAGKIITVKYYLSIDSSITATDIYLGSRTIQASFLKAGASSASAATRTVPATTPAGTYTLGMIVDAANVQAESNETNNTRTGGIIAVTAVPAVPVCSAISPPAPTVTLGSASPLLTATCSNSPTSYVWKVGATTLGCTGATCTVLAANLPTATSYTVTVKANNASGAGTQAASATITVTGPAAASKLNDTGITASQCYQAGSNTLVACSSAGALALNNAQDGMKGRDVTVPTNTDGKLGFSFASVAGGCVLDNVTGLMWEVKTADGGLRDWNKTYTNYSAAYNPSNLYGTATDASGFVAAVNATNLCGFSDWRLPSADELQSIVDYGVAYPGPTIDAAWFPNTQCNVFWSASPNVGYSNYAWYVNFSDGDVSYLDRYYSYYVRLVRAGQ